MSYLLMNLGVGELTSALRNLLGLCGIHSVDEDLARNQKYLEFWIPPCCKPRLRPTGVCITYLFLRFGTMLA